MRAFSGKYNACILRLSVDHSLSSKNVNTNENSIHCQSLSCCPLMQRDGNKGSL